MRPVPETPVAALEFARLGMKAGLPAGTLNVVTGDAEAGSALAGHLGMTLDDLRLFDRPAFLRLPIRGRTSHSCRMPPLGQ